MPEYANANGYSIFTHSWTVGVELKFYLLFPPIVFLMIKSANWRFAATAIMAALLTAIGSFNAQSYCAILFGAMLALGMERPRGYAATTRFTTNGSPTPRPFTSMKTGTTAARGINHQNPTSLPAIPTGAAVAASTRT